MSENRLAWALPGHTREYCLNLVGHDHENYIPRSIEQQLRAALPSHEVSNRGSRIELIPRDPEWVDRERSILPETMHQEVLATVEEICGPTDLVVCEVQPIPPVLRVCGKDGCTEEYTLRDLLQHRREQHP